MALARGWTVSDTLTDKGKSAYKGHHLLPDAALGSFMKQLRRGEIPAGTILIADNLSRLSRRPVDEAMAWIYEVNSAGVVIALADKNEVYEANPDIGEIITRAVNLGVAYKASQDKSDLTRVSKTKLWEKAQTRTGKWTNLANRIPSWLERNAACDGWIVDDRIADVVRDIYQWSADGLGIVTITRLLNERGDRPFASPTQYPDGHHQWQRSSVRQLLTFPAVEGDLTFKSGMFQGRVVHGFYPRIVDADVVARARADLAGRRKVAGEGSKSGTVNLFAGISRCAVCDRRAFLTTSVQKGKAYPYLRCEAAQEGRCTNRNGYAYGGFEKTVLDLFLDLSMDDRFFEASDELRTGRIRKAEIEKEIADKRAARMRLLTMFADDNDADAMILIGQRKTEIDALTSELTSVDRAIAAATGKVSNAEHLRRVGDIRDAAESEVEAVRMQARGKLRLALSSIIMSVEIGPDETGQKVFTVILKGGIMAVRIDTKGRVLKGVSEAAGQPFHHFLTEDQKVALAPVISRIEKLAA